MDDDVTNDGTVQENHPVQLSQSTRDILYGPIGPYRKVGEPIPCKFALVWYDQTR